MAIRLTCPNCGADYDVADGMIPAGGRHVQCTACHTRWFVRGVPGTGMTEEQILSRLESWTPGPRPLPVPSPVAAVPMPAAPLGTPKVVPLPGAGVHAEEAAETRAEAAPRLEPEPPVVVHLPPRPAPAKPGDRPAAVAQPAPLTPPAPPPPAARLDLGEAAAPRPSPTQSRSRFGTGLLLALVLAALAAGAYLYRAPLAARLPQAAPALSAYGDAVDRWRAVVEEQIARFRPVRPD